MSKSRVRPLQFQTRADPDTGARVTRLTPPEVTCHRNYFYQKCFFNDGRKLVFAGEFGPGTDWNYHLLDLDAQTSTQLTDQPGENTFGGFLSPDDRFLYFVRQKNALVRLDLRDLTEQVVYQVPAGWVGYGTWVPNSACTKVVGIEIAQSDWFELSDWQKFNEMFARKPLCQLFTVDLLSGERKTVLEQKGWLGHPQFRPFDDTTLAYCHEGPHDQIDARMWFINEDGTQRRCGKVHAPGESCTHEFWVPDGSAMVYVSYQHGSPERWIRALEGADLQDRAIMQIPPCSHLMSNHDGSLVVGDGCGSAATGNNAMLQGDPYLHLFDLRKGTSRALARHDSSWGVYKGDRQVTHPHPSFNPDGTQVLFSCDKRGEPGLFLVDL